MKKSILFCTVILAFSSFTIAGCVEGNGELTTKRLELKEFSELSIRTKAKIFLYQGPEQKVDIIAESNLIEFLKTDVTDSDWAVVFDRCIIPTKQIEIHITLKNLVELEINSASDVVAEDVIKGDELEIEINGASDLNFNVDYNKLSTEINGAGDISYKGRAAQHNIDVRGAGDIKAYDLISDIVHIDIKGAGDVNVSAAKELKVSIQGAGDVKYKGSPAVLEFSKYGAGEVKKVE